MFTHSARVLSVLILVGCGGNVSSGAGNNTGAQAGGDPTPDASPEVTTTTPATYDGKGFVVHEWGTNTVVVGSDGSLQRGLHHEEEDLPSFVYDRMKQGEVSVEVKMETPVTYFYSDTPRSVTVNVGFPKGLFSQWYPKVQRFEPGLVTETAGKRDPFMDPTFPYASDTCRVKALTPQNGILDWGKVDILARDEAITAPDAPLDKYTWGYARNVASNGVRVAGSESEKFLFYRGLGNLPMGVTITSKGENQVHLDNGDASEAVGTVFVLDVTTTGAAFVAHEEGIAPGGSLDETAPAPTLSLDDYASKLATAMTDALVKSGLYRDEATGMVNTWSRQWFRTPGIRVLYLAPPSWTDAQIPLSITPKPDKQVRVMVIRNEVLTPALEEIDLKAATTFDSDESAAKAYFLGLGRFAEPRLRRALQRLGSTPTAAKALLATLEGPDATRASE
ncbi:MAG: hypothetical protein ACXVEF_25645 [Polyangiales bacterium]